MGRFALPTHDFISFVPDEVRKRPPTAGVPK
jgi:hypothetical protein